MLSNVYTGFTAGVLLIQGGYCLVRGWRERARLEFDLGFVSVVLACELLKGITP